MNSKLLTVTVALTQLLIENLDRLEAHGFFQRKLKQVARHFLELLLAQSAKLFKNMPPDSQLVFFQEIKVLETIIREYQNGTLQVIEESELKSKVA